MSDKNNIPNTKLSEDDPITGDPEDLENLKKIKIEDLTAREKSMVEIVVPKDSFLERGFRFVVKTIAGQNGIGRAGAVVKDALSQVGLLPPVLNKGSDLIGNALKRKQNISTMDKPKLLSKTVWSAIIIALTALLQAFGVDLASDPELTVHIYETIYGLAGAFGLYGLRDAISKQIEKS